MSFFKVAFVVLGHVVMARKPAKATWIFAEEGSFSTVHPLVPGQMLQGPEAPGAFGTFETILFLGNLVAFGIQ